MANIKWISDVTAAWSTGAAWAGGAAPGAGDNAIFDGAHVGAVTDPAAATTITSCYVHPLYTGNMGTSANKLRVSCTGALIYRGSGAEAWFKGTMNAVVCETSVYTASAFNLEGTFAGNDVCIILRGRCNISGTGGYGDILIGRSLAGDEPQVVISSSVTINRFFMHAGRASGSSFEITNDAAFFGGLAQFTDMTSIGSTDLVIDGGTLQLFGTANLTIDTIRMERGVFDISQMRGLFTNSSHIIVGHNAEANLDNGQPLTVAGGWYGVVLPGGRLKTLADPAGLWRL